MTKQTEALRMAIEAMERAEEVDWELNSLHVLNILQAIAACKEALEQPTNMVAVPADQLEKMQQELKQLRKEHKKWQGFARRTS